MKQVIQHTRHFAIRFCRWTRRSWAIFNSLKRVVNIGCLIVPAANQAMLKTVTLVIVERIITHLISLDDDDEHELDKNLAIQQFAFANINSKSISESSSSIFPTNSCSNLYPCDIDRALYALKRCKFHSILRL